MADKEREYEIKLLNIRLLLLESYVETFIHELDEDYISFDEVLDNNKEYQFAHRMLEDIKQEF